MTTGNFSKTSLLAVADAVYPPAGTIGYVILLKPDIALNLVASVNAATNILTTASPHGLVTGSRVQIASTGTVPTPLSAASEYYVIATSPTALLLSDTSASAAAGTPIDLTDAGTGSVTLNEQQVNADDSIEALVNKELPSVGVYTRLPLASVGAATLTDGVALKNPQVEISNFGTIDFSFGSALVAIGASSTIGDIVGITAYGLVSESVPQTVSVGQTLNISIKLEVSN